MRVVVRRVSKSRPARSMTEEVLAIWAYTRQSILYVTHSIQEAVFVADRVIVLSRRPGEVLDTVPIRLARPCGEHQQGDPAFIQASDRIWGLIKSQAQAALLGVLKLTSSAPIFVGVEKGYCPSGPSWTPPSWRRR